MTTAGAVFTNSTINPIQVHGTEETIIVNDDGSLDAWYGIIRPAGATVSLAIWLLSMLAAFVAAGLTCFSAGRNLYLIR